MKKFITWILMLLCCCAAFGQSKYEREYRIKDYDVPEKALEFINSWEFNKKVKWFYEVNFKGNSVEAKTKIDKRPYSIEFDTLGNFQDIEIEQDLIEVPEKVRKEIKQKLDLRFTKYRIKKLQLQYSGAIPDFSTFKDGNQAEKLEVKYEIVLRAKNEDGWKLMEMLFDKNGEVESSIIIELRNTDNLEF